jgi:hypothetical protein
MKLVFSAVRPLEEDEWKLVQSRMDEQAAIDAVTMTIADIDGVEEAPAAPAESPVFIQPRAAAPAPAAEFKVDKPKAKAKVVEEVEEPVVRETKTPAPPNVKSILSDWGDDADD